MSVPSGAERPSMIRPLRVETRRKTAPPARRRLRPSVVARGIRRHAGEPLDGRRGGARSRGADRLRGFVVSRLAADEAEILTVAVDAAHRGSRRRARLIARPSRRPPTPARGRSSSKSTRTTRAALALYRRFGFARVGERAGYYRRPDGLAAGDRHAQGSRVSLRPAEPFRVARGGFCHRPAPLSGGRVGGAVRYRFRAPSAASPAARRLATFAERAPVGLCSASSAPGSASPSAGTANSAPRSGS